MSERIHVTDADEGYVDVEVRRPTKQDYIEKVQSEAAEMGVDLKISTGELPDVTINRPSGHLQSFQRERIAGPMTPQEIALQQAGASAVEHAVETPHSLR